MPLTLTNELEATTQRQFRRPDLDQATAPQGFAQRQPGQAANTQPRLDSPLDRFGMLELQTDIGIDADRVHGPIE